MTMYKQLFFALVIFFSCFAGAYFFMINWQIQHAVLWYAFCLILLIILLFKKGTDE